MGKCKPIVLPQQEDVSDVRCMDASDENDRACAVVLGNTAGPRASMEHAACVKLRPFMSLEGDTSTAGITATPLPDCEL